MFSDYSLRLSSKPHAQPVYEALRAYVQQQTENTIGAGTSSTFHRWLGPSVFFFNPGPIPIIKNDDEWQDNCCDRVKQTKQEVKIQQSNLFSLLLFYTRVHIPNYWILWMVLWEYGVPKPPDMACTFSVRVWSIFPAVSRIVFLWELDSAEAARCHPFCSSQLRK